MILNYFKKGVCCMLQKFLYLIITIFYLTTTISCATIISGRSQELPVLSVPSEAIVTIGGMKQMTPATFILDRRMGVYVVKIEKEGYESVEIALKKGVNGWVFGNLLVGGIIGLIIDISTGSASKFTPDEVEVNLIKKELGLNTLEGKDVLIVKLKEQSKL